MMKLFQREECPACTRVRKVMADLNLTFETQFVPRLGSQRSELLALDGVDNAEVPALVDGDTTIQGSDAIVEYLNTKYRRSDFGDPTYGLTRTIEGMRFADAVGATREALSEEGFGVLTEIDVKATLKKKLDVDVNNYLILGACNPPLAHQALQAEPALGLLLPCNVVVTEDSKGNAVVSAIDPKKMFQVVDNDGIESIAMDVRAKLAKALSQIKGA